jgi:hypothetical protein
LEKKAGDEKLVARLWGVGSLRAIADLAAPSFGDNLDFSLRWSGFYVG